MSSICQSKPLSAAEAWTYIVRLYDQPGVSGICLDWQDRLGVDAILVLSLLWLGSEMSQEMNEESLRRVEQRASEWRNATVLPIRLARRASGELAKAGDREATSVYRRLKRMELAAERLALKRIIRRRDFGAHHPSPQLAATRNLELYLRLFVGSDTRAEKETIERLVLAALTLSGQF